MARNDYSLQPASASIEHFKIAISSPHTVLLDVLNTPVLPT